MGSSPRIRGEYAARAKGLHTARIIPANTGRIARNRGSSTLPRDHPREYGENMQECVNEHTKVGSSPRIRGEYHTRHAMHQRHGIIPANTGRMGLYGGGLDGGGIIPANTGRIVQGELEDALAEDHPREYGENTNRKGSEMQIVGSSPRIRGECGIGDLKMWNQGIIPANTGRMHIFINSST